MSVQPTLNWPVTDYFHNITANYDCEYEGIVQLYMLTLSMTTGWFAITLYESINSFLFI